MFLFHSVIGYLVVKQKQSVFSDLAVKQKQNVATCYWPCWHSILHKPIEFLRSLIIFRMLLVELKELANCDK